MLGLLKAAREGGLTRVQRLIREGADVTETDENGRTLLLLAAYGEAGYSHIAMMQWLLEEGGSSMTATTYSGLTVWNLLLMYGDTCEVTLSCCRRCSRLW
jgi:ankyrin repeat protein